MNKEQIQELVQAEMYLDGSTLASSSPANRSRSGTNTSDITAVEIGEVSIIFSLFSAGGDLLLRTADFIYREQEVKLHVIAVAAGTRETTATTNSQPFRHHQEYPT